MSRRIPALFLIAACALAQVPSPPEHRIPIDHIPIFTASHAATGSKDVSPGSQVVLRLSGFGLPIDDLRRLDRVRVELQLRDSPFVFTPALLPETASQLRAVLPENLPLGEVYVYLLVDGERKMSTTIRVVPTAPGIYTELGGFGPALAHQYDEHGASLNGLTHPAVPGQLVTLWATGLGAAPEQAIVELAGRDITPDFAGRNPVIAGLDQINFRVPEDAPLGCYIPVAIRSGDRASKLAALAIGGNAGACPHPLPLNYSELSALEADRTIDMASFDVASAASDPADRQEGAQLEFGRLDKRAAFVFGRYQLPDALYYSCLSGTEFSVGFTPFYPDAGSPPVFTGPDGRQIQLAASGYGRPLRPPDGPFDAPGRWLLTVFGGADIAGFQQSFRVPPPVRLREIVIRPGQDTIVTWDPSGYLDGDVMTVTFDTDLVCRAPAWMGRITIPAPESAPLIFELEPHPATRPRFRVPLTDGTSLPGIGSYLYREVKR